MFRVSPRRRRRRGFNGARTPPPMWWEALNLEDPRGQTKTLYLRCARASRAAAMRSHTDSERKRKGDWRRRAFRCDVCMGGEIRGNLNRNFFSETKASNFLSFNRFFYSYFQNSLDFFKDLKISWFFLNLLLQPNILSIIIHLKNPWRSLNLFLTFDSKLPCIDVIFHGGVNGRARAFLRTGSQASCTQSSENSGNARDFKGVGTFRKMAWHVNFAIFFFTHGQVFVGWLPKYVQT